MKSQIHVAATSRTPRAGRGLPLLLPNLGQGRILQCPQFHGVATQVERLADPMASFFEPVEAAGENGQLVPPGPPAAPSSAPRPIQQQSPIARPIAKIFQRTASTSGWARNSGRTRSSSSLASLQSPRASQPCAASTCILSSRSSGVGRIV